MENYHKGKTCPYCQYPIKQKAAIYLCNECNIPHHKECWEENRGCTTYGCTGSVTKVRNTSSSRESPGRRAESEKVDVEFNNNSGDSNDFRDRSSASHDKEALMGIVSFAVSVLIVLLYLSGFPGEFVIVSSLLAFIFGLIGLFQTNRKRYLSSLGVFLALFMIVMANINNEVIDNTFEVPESSHANETNDLIRVPEDYEKIQDALDSAQSGDEIVVAEGIYNETINFNGKEVVLRSQNPESSETVAATIIDGNNNGSTVTFNSGESRDAVIKGFTITGGSGTRDQYSITSYSGSRLNFERNYGGGVLITGKSNPTVSNNLIIDNITQSIGADVLGLGGGIAILDDSSPLIENNTVKENKSQGHGGGIAVWYKSSPEIKNNIIENNYASEIAGGILVAMMCEPVISGNTVNSNQSDDWSGGIYVAHMSKADITDNIISQNRADTGAGIFVRQTDGVVISDNRLEGNVATRNGGAIYLDNEASVRAENNLIENNSARSGGGIWVDRDSRIQVGSPDQNSYQNNSPDNVYEN